MTLDEFYLFIFLLCSFLSIALLLVGFIKIVLDEKREQIIRNKYGSDFKKSADEYFEGMA